MDSLKSLISEFSEDKVTLIMAREDDADYRDCILEMRIGKLSWLKTKIFIIIVSEINVSMNTYDKMCLLLNPCYWPALVFLIVIR